MRRLLLLMLGLSGLMVSDAMGQTTAVDPAYWENYIRLNYVKQEHMIPMRDGTKLFTAVFIPRDTTKTYPILMKRTPYSCAPYGINSYPPGLGPSEHFVKAGYIFVNQDVRGRFMSEGTFQQVTPHIPKKSGPNDIDESTDAYDTIDWLIKNVPGTTAKSEWPESRIPGSMRQPA